MPALRYRISNLFPPISSGWAMDINDLGTAVRAAQKFIPADEPFDEEDGRLDLSWLICNGSETKKIDCAENTAVRPEAINNSGQVVGEYSQRESPQGGWSQDAFIYENGEMTLLPTADLQMSLLKYDGHRSFAKSINNVGDVIAGHVWTDSDPPYEGIQISYPVVWERGTTWKVRLLDLRRGEVRDVNDRGEGAGYVVEESAWLHAAIWTKDEVRDLGALSGGRSEATAINNNGQVVGWSLVGTDCWRGHAFVWDPSSGMTDLGVIVGHASRAYDINDAGQIVGHSLAFSKKKGVSGGVAALWENGEIYDLNDLISPARGWHLESARAINNKGQIVGEGRRYGRDRAFLLTPE